MMSDYISIHGYGIGLLRLLIIAAVIIVPFWQLFSKAGYAGWFMVLPLINLIALYVLARSIPAFTLATIISRSSSEKTPNIWNGARPLGV